jgi:hypothetical protein
MIKLFNKEEALAEIEIMNIKLSSNNKGLYTKKYN